MLSKISPEEQLRIIQKGTEKIVNEETLLQKLKKSNETGKPLTIKFGLDPSAPDIHIGHAVPLRKIRQMQDLGHRTVIVIGDFTGRIGDPTGRTKGRAALSDEQVRENAETYCEQIFKVIDKEKTEIRFNSEWLSKLTFAQVVELASSTTVARMLERDDFQSRYKNEIPIGLHEFFYPLMQAYDSVALEADIELGGTDQTFNILMGRTLQRAVGQEPQAAVFMPLLEGLDGVEKMSKSLGNYIGVYESAEVIFKKVMEIPDSLIIKYYELATDEHPDKVDRIASDLRAGMNPRDAKYDLAKIITGLYHGENEARRAAEYYDAAFSRKGIPENIPELPLRPGGVSGAASALVESGFVKSRSELNRLAEQGGLQLNGEKLGRDALANELSSGDVLRIGKKKFVRFV